jgi:putative transcriptional regulator
MAKRYRDLRVYFGTEYQATGKRPYASPLTKRELAEVDVAAIRKRLNLSQARFAHRFGFPVATLRHWEQGKRKPRGCALALLHVIAYNPAIAMRAILKAKSPFFDSSPLDPPKE